MKGLPLLLMLGLGAMEATAQEHSATPITIPLKGLVAG